MSEIPERDPVSEHARESGPGTAPPGAPRRARRLLAWLLPDDLRACQVGDLDEEYVLRAADQGRALARRWYRRQVRRSLLPALSSRLRGWRSAAPRRRPTMDGFSQDIRFALRSLRRSPGFVVAAVVTLALGIGVTCSIFSLVNAVVFADLPMEDPDNFWFVSSASRRGGQDKVMVSLPDFLDLRRATSSFEGLAAARTQGVILTGDGEPQRLTAFAVTANFLDVWGVPTVHGRDFRPGEDSASADAVALLSHGLWERRFGSDPGVVGRPVRLDGVEHTVVGVVAERMEFGNLAATEVYVPLNVDASSVPRDRRDLLVTGRLAPGVTRAQAEEETAALGRRLAREHPETSAGWTLQVTHSQEELAGEAARVLFMVLAVSVALVLLIACVNIANMLLARGVSRQKELAVRMALGAGRGRLLRQLLAESGLVSLLAAGLGLASTWGLRQVFLAITRHQNVLLLEAEIDVNVVGFTLLVAVVAPLLFGLMPAVRTTGTDPNETLKENAGRGSAGRGGLRSRGLLVAAQAAMAVIVLVAAGLIFRTVVNIESHELGFDPSGLLTGRVELPESDYPDSRRVRELFQQAEERLEALSGVEAAELVRFRPLATVLQPANFEIQGWDSQEWEVPSAGRNVVGPGYFDLLGVPILAGRPFRDTDGPDAPPVALVNREAVERYWPGDDAVGARIRLGSDGDAGGWTEVVGVVDTITTGDLDEPEAPEVYVPFAQRPVRDMAVVARTVGDPLAAVAGLRGVFRELDPDLPVTDVRSMGQIRYDDVSEAYVLVTLFAVFAVFSLVMASAGVYGVMSWSVSQRTREIGIRMALGARGEDVRGMIIRQGAWLTLAGTAVGMLGALAVGRVLASVLFEVSPTDPLTFVGVPAVMLAVALLANWIPARRATRVDPMTSLRAS